MEREREREPSAVAAPEGHDYRLILTVSKHKTIVKKPFRVIESDRNRGRSSKRSPLTQKPSHCIELSVLK